MDGGGRGTKEGSWLNDGGRCWCEACHYVIAALNSMGNIESPNGRVETGSKQGRHKGGAGRARKAGGQELEHEDLGSCSKAQLSRAAYQPTPYILSHMSPASCFLLASLFFHTTLFGRDATSM